MPIDADRLLRWRPPPMRQRFGPREVISYALATGLGADPLDERQLRFVYEKDLLSLPTLPTVLAFESLVALAQAHGPALGIDWRHALHGAQALRLHAQVPVEGEVVSTTRVVAVHDKGPGQSAFVRIERELNDAFSGSRICTLTSTTVCREGGGFGGTAPPDERRPVPAREPDERFVQQVLPQAALMYRLCADRNPIHVDPQAARDAGLPRPLLHGLCTFGIASNAVLRLACDYDPRRLRSIRARFRGPLYPGEHLAFEIWREPHVLHFQARTRERGELVLGDGEAEIDAPAAAFFH